MRNFAMAKRTRPKLKLSRPLVVGLIFILVMISAGLLLGTRSTLTLTRDAASGAVTAVNDWRFTNAVPLIRRTVTNVQKVGMKKMSLTETERRSSAYRDVFGMLNVPEQVTITGDSELRYPYREDFWLIDGFLKNRGNRQAILTHPVDIRRTVASWGLLLFGLASLFGWVFKFVTGRDPLAGAPEKVKPLPPKVGAAVFLGTIVVGLWFFAAGHKFFGPLAEAKVKLLLESAKENRVEGITRALHKGVFVDVADGQSTTALMIAASSGAEESVEALLAAGANPGLRDLDDRTALLRAIETKHPRIALRLLDAGTDLTSTDTNGRNALHYAAQVGDADLLRRLLKAGAELNKPDAHGWTALIFAAAYGGADSIRALLDAGADPAKKTSDGRTAADLAAQNPAARELLLGKGKSS